MESAKQFPELHLVKCHGCGKTRWITGALTLDEKGLTYCPTCKCGEGEQEGFGGVNGAPPEADLLRAIEDRNLILVAAFVGAGANIHASEDKALRWAASRGDLDVVEMLLNLGADLTAHNYEALRWAAKEKHQDVVSLLLLRGADPAVLTEATVEEAATAGTTWNAEGGRWWSCPICHVYIDAMVGVGGELVDSDRLRCPKCGCMELDAESGDHFKPGVEKLFPDTIIGGIGKEMKLLIKDARATLTETGLFPPDDSENEPKWPKDLAAVIMAVGTTLAKPHDVRDQASRAIDRLMTFAESYMRRQGITLEDGSSVVTGATEPRVREEVVPMSDLTEGEKRELERLVNKPKDPAQ